jgi:hypothetical protein
MYNLEWSCNKVIKSSKNTVFECNLIEPNLIVTVTLVPVFVVRTVVYTFLGYEQITPISHWQMWHKPVLQWYSAKLWYSINCNILFIGRRSPHLTFMFTLPWTRKDTNNDMYFCIIYWITLLRVAHNCCTTHMSLRNNSLKYLYCA